MQEYLWGLVLTEGPRCQLSKSETCKCVRPRRAATLQGVATSRPSKAPLVAIIPARAGSKGLPGKNVRTILGRPLYSYSVDHAFDAGIEVVLITTDIDEILEASHRPGVVVHRRPQALCGDETPMESVLADVIKKDLFDEATVVLLQATSPLRNPGDIRRAITHYEKGTADLVMSVVPVDSGVLKCGTLEGDRFSPLRHPSDPFANRQALPSVVKPDGSVYVFGASWYRRNGELSTDRMSAIVVDPSTSLDIDTIDDFEHCVQQFARREVRD